jgi:precorrin-3B methylase
MIQLLPETALQLSEDAALQIMPGITYELLEELLAEKLESMISHDFQQFVLLLYRVDVAENRVRLLLEADITPGVYRKIAALLIERQQQKIISRQLYKHPPADDGEEKW